MTKAEQFHKELTDLLGKWDSETYNGIGKNAHKLNVSGRGCDMKTFILEYNIAFDNLNKDTKFPGEV